MEVIYLIFFFVTRGAAFTDQVPQASMEQWKKTALRSKSCTARSSSNASLPRRVGHTDLDRGTHESLRLQGFHLLTGRNCSYVKRSDRLSSVDQGWRN